MVGFAKNKFFMLVFLLPLLSSGMLFGCAMKQQQESVGQYVDGGVITTQVKSKILAAKELRNTSIAVKTYQNQVQLSGIVHTQKQKAYAEMLARSVDGVQSVDNSILVKR